MNSLLQSQADRSVVPVEVRGWLLVLCLILTLFYPTRSVYHILWHTIPIISTAHALNRILLLSVYSFVVSALAVFSFAAGLGLWCVKPKAVGFAKRYLLTYLVAHVAYFVLWIAMIRPTREIDYVEMGWWNIVGPLVFVTLWYSYLEHSRRVRETYLVP